MDKTEDLFACFAKINRDLYLFLLELKKENLLDISFATRSQGKLKEHQNAPIIFVWYFKWESNNIKHEITFEIWKSNHWQLRSEHNTMDRFDFENPQKSDFLFEYSYKNIEEMISAIDETKNSFFSSFKNILNQE